MTKKKSSTTVETPLEGSATATLNGTNTQENGKKNNSEKGQEPEIATKSSEESVSEESVELTSPKKDKKDKDKKSKDNKNKAKKKEKTKELSDEIYLKELEKLQAELVKLQYWVKDKGLKVVVLFEGRDAAGKGGAILRISECLNPRICKVVALGTPTEREKGQWYFQRYVAELPAAGEIALFDRSWYNRAGVEHVMGFCTEPEYVEFLRSCPEFEHMLQRAGIILIKYWFSVSDDEQERRFQDRISDPTKRWKLSPLDLEARSRWVEYSKAKDAMFAATDTTLSPWNVVEGDDKKRARLNCISHLLGQIKYKDLTPPPLKLPKRQKEGDYQRPPREMQKFVPEKF